MNGRAHRWKGHTPAINNAVAGCLATSATGFTGTSYCSNSEPGKSFMKADSYVAWNAGLDAKVTF